MTQWARWLPALLLGTLFVGDAHAQTPDDDSAKRQAVLNHYAAQAKQADPGFRGFDAATGRAFFLAKPGGGVPETPSCTTCHTNDPRRPGRTRAGKEIAPMAVSVTPSRFSDLAKVEQWFRRNCHTVYGRACTPAEKGNYITYMMAQ
jgi:hypothetical protein